jgi:hypothetical protein
MRRQGEDVPVGMVLEVDWLRADLKPPVEVLDFSHSSISLVASPLYLSISCYDCAIPFN